MAAELAVGETVFWIEDESSEHDNVSPEALGGATERLRIVVGDPEAVLKQAAAQGAPGLRGRCRSQVAAWSGG